METKTVYLVSLGCAKNLVDSEHMLAALLEAGYEYVLDPNTARIIIVNTCAFTKPAQRESVETILELAEHKKNGACEYLIVTGCLVQRYAHDITTEMPEVDAVLGTGVLKHLPTILAQLNDGGTPVVCLSKPGGLLEGKRVLLTSSGTAYIKLAEGCCHHCSFCIIPQLRGPLASRSESMILREGQELADQGVGELILIAQDSASYGLDLYGEQRLPYLLKKLVQIDNLNWIRLLYLHPEHIPDSLLTVIAEENKICPYFDLPFQHVSHSILKSMGRKGNKETYAKLLNRIRELMPDAAIRTTFMVGFPGETEDDFCQLLSFMQEHKLDWVGGFAFSPQYNTPAACLPGQVPDQVKQERLRELLRHQQSISRERNQAWLGKKLTVLIEQANDQGGIGRCFRQAPDVDGVTYVNGKNLVPGQFRSVFIDQATIYDLKGRIACELAQ